MFVFFGTHARPNSALHFPDHIQQINPSLHALLMYYGSFTIYLPQFHHTHIIFISPLAVHNFLPSPNNTPPPYFHTNALPYSSRGLGFSFTKANIVPSVYLTRISSSYLPPHTPIFPLNPPSTWPLLKKGHFKCPICLSQWQLILKTINATCISWGDDSLSLRLHNHEREETKNSESHHTKYSQETHYRNRKTFTTPNDVAHRCCPCLSLVGLENMLTTCTRNITNDCVYY
jgi:hypothetical protein